MTITAAIGIPYPTPSGFYIYINSNGEPAKTGDVLIRSVKKRGLLKTVQAYVLNTEALEGWSFLSDTPVLQDHFDSANITEKFVYVKGVGYAYKSTQSWMSSGSGVLDYRSALSLCEYVYTLRSPSHNLEVLEVSTGRKETLDLERRTGFSF